MVLSKHMRNIFAGHRIIHDDPPLFPKSARFGVVVTARKPCGNYSVPICADGRHFMAKGRSVLFVV